jgi:spore germination protein KA
VQIGPWLRKLITVDDGILDEQFSLEEDGNAKDSAGDESPKGESPEPDDTSPEAGDGRRGEQDGRRSDKDDGRGERLEADDSDGRGELKVRRPIPVREMVRSAARERSAKRAPTHECVTPDIAESKAILSDIFHVPVNKDIVIREFSIGTERPTKALAVFIDGMSDKNIINTHILQPLMLLAHISGEANARRMEVVKEALLPGNQVSEMSSWDEITAGILTGSTIVLVDGCDTALLVETKGWEHRTVGLTQAESVVRGPHDAFTENFRANTGLVRARLRSEDLITEMFSVGTQAKTDVAIMYIHGLTNEQLIAEVRRRIKAIDVDFLSDSGMLEQFIDDNPNVMIPQTLSTERPDRIVHMLMEGHVAIFVGHSPYVLAVPVVFWTLMHSPEDAYLRVPFGSFLRCIRWIAVVFATFLPAVYVAVTNYHPEMIPTDLMLAIAGSREQVPFPVLLEVAMMEFAIELIREAGIRIPSVIGPTIGIVGALIIGQAAVQAGVVSPLLVIVVAITALASFSIPNYNLGFAVRMYRFIYLLVAAFFGFYGITLLFCVMLARLSVQKSFGVPLFAPVTPSMDASRDVFLRAPAYSMNQRPPYLRTKKQWRQRPYTRTWNKSVKRMKENEGDDQT